MAMESCVDELLDYWFGFDVPLNMEVIKYINTLKDKGLLIFLATQNEKYRTEKFLKMLEPSLKYDFLIATYQVGYKKSNSLYFTSCLKKYKFQACL